MRARSQRRLLAFGLGAALLVQGAASAYDPVHCAMTGAVSAGRCDCDHPDGEPAAMPRCCLRLEAGALPSLLRAPPATDTIVPVLYVVGTPAPIALPIPRQDPATARTRGPSPPLQILHRALLR